MFKQLLTLVRKIIVSSFMIYGFNLIAGSFGLMIPINLFTVLLVSCLGLPAIFSLILILLMMF